MLGLMITTLASAVLYIDKQGDELFNLVVEKCNRVSYPAIGLHAMGVIKFTAK
jgi:hypothetical protein